MFWVLFTSHFIHADDYLCYLEFCVCLVTLSGLDQCYFYSGSCWFVLVLCCVSSLNVRPCCVLYCIILELWDFISLRGNNIDLMMFFMFRRVWIEELAACLCGFSCE